MRKYPILPIISAMLVIAGVVLVGVSVAQKVEMNANSGSYVLPELAFHGKPAEKSTQIAIRPIKRGDYLGTLFIAGIKKTIPIYEGTESEQLKKGIGHYEGSVQPGVKDNSILAGHRDSVFSQLGKLKVGELLVIHSASGIYTYKISHFRIVKSDDRTVIVPTKNAVLTLSTCYPFYFIGPAPKRFIVSANLISTRNAGATSDSKALSKKA
ncbi:MAG: class D sortase [Actinobacteria bacterium]|nr:class D sortase [Actinomycetota bacterium]